MKATAQDCGKGHPKALDMMSMPPPHLPSVQGPKPS